MENKVQDPLVVDFETDGMFLLDLVQYLETLEIYRWDDYTVAGKFGSCHRLKFDAIHNAVTAKLRWEGHVERR